MNTEVKTWYRKVESSCEERSLRVVEDVIPKVIRIYCGKSNTLCNYKNCPKRNERK